MSIEPLVKAVGIERLFRQGNRFVAAVRSASFDIFPGERVALIGPSGSGKSTLLQLVAALDRPSAGYLAWPLLGAAESLRPLKIALVFQVPSLLPELTALENVEIPLLLGGAAEDPRRAAKEALERVGLSGLSDKLPEELSGGQAQRVAVARALAARPALILADEPTGQLDHPTARQLFDALLQSLEGTKTALVVATHDRSVAERMRSVWQMRRGSLEMSVERAGAAWSA